MTTKKWCAVAAVLFMVCGAAMPKDMATIDRIRDLEARARYYQDARGVCHEYHDVSIFGVLFYYATYYPCEAIPSGALLLNMKK